MKISDLRIGIKLALGFFGVVLLTTVLGAIALVQMSRIHANAQDVATNLLPSVVQTGELRVLLNRMRCSEAGIVTARSTAEVAAFAQQLDARHKDLGTVEVSSYKANIASASSLGKSTSAWQVLNKPKAPAPSKPAASLAAPPAAAPAPAHKAAAKAGGNDDDWESFRA